MIYNNLPSLTTNVLWDTKLQADEYKSLNDVVLYDAITQYISDIESNSQEWHAADTSPLSLYITDYQDICSYQKILLSTEKVILNDVLFDIYMDLQDSHMDLMVTHFIDNAQKQAQIEVRQKIVKFMQFVKEYFDLIQSGFIAFTFSLVSHHKRTQKTKIILDTPDPKFLQSVMPEFIAKIYTEKLKVKGIKRIENTNMLSFVPDEYLPNEIMLELDGCLSPYVNGYMFHTLEYIQNNNGTINSRITRGQHTNLNDWKSWTRSSSNRSIYTHWMNLLMSLQQSANNHASFGAYCPLQSQILKHIDGNNNITRRMLNINTPFLNNISLHNIHDIRLNYEASFSTYLSSLRDCALEIERAKDDSEITLLQKRFQERIMDEGLNDVSSKIAAWKRKSTIDTALITIPVILGFLTAPSSIVLSAFPLMQAIYGAYTNRETFRIHPSYFIFKASTKK